MTPLAPGSTFTCVRVIDRAADWLADAGYEVVDAEPPLIAEAAAAWIETIWADVGTLWPGMEPMAGPHQLEVVAACLGQGVFGPVDQICIDRAAFPSP